MSCVTVELIEKFIVSIQQKNAFYFYNTEYINEIPIFKNNDLGKLYVGDCNVPHYIHDLSLNLILSLFPVNNEIIYDNCIRYEFDIQDNINLESYDKMNEILDECVPIINKTLLSGKNVAVHCMGGISRSTTVILDYLLTYNFNNNLNDIYLALSYLILYRKVARPNKKFLELILNRHMNRIKSNK
jgi:hypothetical protein